MSVKQRAGWGAIRATLAAATSDILAIKVTGLERRQPTVIGASFLQAAPGPAEEGGKARVVLYTGNEPQANALSPADGTPLEGQPFVRRSWLDVTIRYGEPLLIGIGFEEAEAGLDWWACIGCPIDSTGVAYDCVAALTLWGRP